MTWQNRIVGHGDVDPRTIVAHPLNFRTHPEFQKDALRGALDQVGFVQSVIVNKRSGRLLDGHARVEIALADEQPTVPVVFVDLSESEEKLVLATLDKIGSLAGTDPLRLNELMHDVATDDPSLMQLLDQMASEARLVPAPESFGEVDPDKLETEHKCPQCGYEWSGKSNSGAPSVIEGLSEAAQVESGE